MVHSISGLRRTTIDFTKERNTTIINWLVEKYVCYTFKIFRVLSFLYVTLLPYSIVPLLLTLPRRLRNYA